MFHAKCKNRRRVALLFAVSSYATAAFSAASAETADSVVNQVPLPVAEAPGLADANSGSAALLAEAPVATAATNHPAKSQNVTINLINRLVEKGVLGKDDAADLIHQAEADAEEARAQAAAVQAASTQAAAAQAAAAQATAPAPEEEDLRVTYIPEVVKEQMREQLKQEVMDQARKEGWAAPNLLPPWVTKMRVFGDVRVRYENLSYPAGNDNTGAFPNFNAINTGAPFDVAGNVFSPQWNVDQNRNRVRLRVRAGAEVNLDNGFTAGLRIATGENNSPVSTNQSLGYAGSGQGGNFSKYALWLDRGFLKYELGGLPNKNLAISAGRFDNPFFSTDIVWDDDIGFDGFALQGKYEVVNGVTPFLTAGAFPVYNTDLNFSSNRPDKFASYDKWLYAGQIGTDWKIDKKIALKVGAAYYDFNNINGRLSDPYTPLTNQDAGNTDASRPAFAQKGNTYMPLRRIIPTADNSFGTTNQWQYFGLATPFRVLALTGKLDISYWEPATVTLFGEYAKNLAFDRQNIDWLAVNNRGPADSRGISSFEGGDTAWIAGFKVGKPVFEKAWDWSLGLNYRYVESDAVVDGFTDSDFAGGGTNVKGYTFSGSLAVSKNVWFGLRWMTGDEIAGPPMKVDVFQVDLNGKF